jgi:hypothetical protein
MTLSQSVATLAPAVSAEAVAMTFTGLALTGFWREQRALREDMRTWQAKINTTLFGPNGDNGLNGTSKDHETRIRALEHD